ncbi:hypothetical protein QR680_019106 [Steinernema hermaphroditum]|uniref:Carboxylesterase type B domain-containing protein n=1 Tax=Steinernema hermaphroditum TaxID=289476 RepID=A0AA39HJY1_9BILA|nr:hypothetical protein QR680_019106 [Steinernema hermaphroditum]
MADKGIDLIVSKLLMVKDEKATYSVTGRVYRINDIVIRIGRAVVNGVAKNVLIELAYEATIDQQLIMGSHLRHYVMFRETFTPSDIADHFVPLFGHYEGMMRLWTYTHHRSNEEFLQFQLLFLLLEAEGNFGAADRNIVVMTVVYLGLLGFANFIGRVSFLYDDYTFFVPSWQDVAETTKVGGPAFFYEFTYPFIYLLGIHAGKFTEKDEIVREKFSQLFANFINTRRHLHRRIPLGALWSSYFRIDFDAQNRLPGMTSGYHTQTVHFLERVGEGRNDVLYEATEFWPDIYITKGLIPEEAKANFPTLKPGGANLDDSTNWSLLFKIAAALNIVLVILALIMCMMRCYNMKMRKEYERLK